MQKTYRLDPKQLEKQKRNIILLYGITGIVSIGLMYFTQRARGLENSPWLLIGLMVVLLAFFGYRSYKQRIDLWDGYLLSVDEEGLTQSQPNYPDSKLAFSRIIEAEESKEGLWISTNQGQKVFIIPSLLIKADYDELGTLIRQKIALRKSEESIPDDFDDQDTLEQAVISVASEAEGMDEEIEEK